MPPRSLSTASAVSVLDWHDNEAYVSTFDTKAVNQPIDPLTKSLRFSDKPLKVFPIPHLDDYSDEEIAAVWFEASEYANMKNEYKDTVFLMECGQVLDEIEHTKRGLEYRTQEGAWARYENKRDAYNAVLDEQDIQWKEDYDDDEALRRVYLKHSTKCGIAAHKLAMQDASDAEAIFAEASEGSSTTGGKPTKIVKKKSSLRRLFSKSSK